MIASFYELNELYSVETFLANFKINNKELNPLNMTKNVPLPIFCS